MSYRGAESATWRCIRKVRCGPLWILTLCRVKSKLVCNLLNPPTSTTPKSSKKAMQVSCANRNFPLGRSSFSGYCNHGHPERPSTAAVSVRRRNAAAGVRAVSECWSCGPEVVEMEEWREMLKWGDKCRGSSSGLVELLECLEREAIMGQDEGREPLDYNRRAQIFDKSGRVFQALKQQQSDGDDVHSQA